jgi:hypothetical protein
MFSSKTLPFSLLLFYLISMACAMPTNQQFPRGPAMDIETKNLTSTAVELAKRPSCWCWVCGERPAQLRSVTLPPVGTNEQTINFDGVRVIINFLGDNQLRFFVYRWDISRDLWSLWFGNERIETIVTLVRYTSGVVHDYSLQLESPVVLSIRPPGCDDPPQ